MNLVDLVWTTQDGEWLIGDMARVSAPENQGKDAKQLIQYLIKNKHWSPFEMANAVFEINTTRDIARQLLRHRSFTFQEFSQRYASVEKLEEAPNRQARLQDNKNRQNSIDNANDGLKSWWNSAQKQVRELSNSIYTEALQAGIAKEVARVVLPEGLTPSKLYMNGSIRSWIHFCQLRCGNGTQKETQKIAEEIQEILMHFYPNTWKALLNDSGRT